MFAHLLKGLMQITSAEYRAIVCKSALAPLITDLVSELTKEIPDANKQTVETIVKKCTLLRRLLYTLNKHKDESKELTQTHGSVQELTIPGGDLLLKLQIKEKLAIKMLSQDDLKHFMTIKTNLVESTILMMNLGWVEAESEMLKILQQGIFIEKLPNEVL